METKEKIIEDVVNKQNLEENEKKLLLDFLEQMLELEPAKRIDAKSALEHEIFGSKERNNKRLNKNSVKVLERLMHYRVILY